MATSENNVDVHNTSKGPHFVSDEITILVIGGGHSYQKLEEALARVSQDSIEGSKEIGVEVMKLRTIVVPSLSSEEFLTKNGFKTKVDYVVIMLDQLNPSTLDRAEIELSLLEKTLVARNRVGFCLWKNSSKVSQLKSEKLSEFCKRQSACLDCIRHDDDASIDFNAQLLYNRVFRMFQTPMM